MADTLTAAQLQVTIGVLALQGAFAEHLTLLRHAASHLASQIPPFTLNLIEVRTPTELSRTDALIIPGGESTSMALIAERTGMLEPLRAYIRQTTRPVWGTCAGLILLAQRADRTARLAPLLGGLEIRVRRNYFGRQVDSFEANLEMPLVLGENGEGFHAVFIRAPVVEALVDSPSSSLMSLSTVGGDEGGKEKTAKLNETVTEDNELVRAPPLFSNSPTTASVPPTVEILARLPPRARTFPSHDATAAQKGEDGAIVAVRQGHVFGTAFHPELTGDARIHAWWLGEVVKAVSARAAGTNGEGLVEG